jgi:hypothetical protein
VNRVERGRPGRGKVLAAPGRCRAPR